MNRSMNLPNPKNGASIALAVGSLFVAGALTAGVDSTASSRTVEKTSSISGERITCKTEAYTCKTEAQTCKTEAQTCKAVVADVDAIG